jgi:hypothetical protein
VKPDADSESCCICGEDYPCATAEVNSSLLKQQENSDKHKLNKFTSINDPSPCKLPGCGHVFHRNCIGRWLRRRNTCPVCRSELETIPSLSSLQKMAASDLVKHAKRWGLSYDVAMEKPGIIGDEDTVSVNKAVSGVNNVDTVNAFLGGGSRGTDVDKLGAVISATATSDGDSEEKEKAARLELRLKLANELHCFLSRKPDGEEEEEEKEQEEINRPLIRTAPPQPTQDGGDGGGGGDEDDDNDDNDGYGGVVNAMARSMAIAMERSAAARRRAALLRNSTDDRHLNGSSLHGLNASRREDERSALSFSEFTHNSGSTGGSGLMSTGQPLTHAASMEERNRRNREDLHEMRRNLDNALTSSTTLLTSSTTSVHNHNSSSVNQNGMPIIASPVALALNSIGSATSISNSNSGTSRTLVQRSASSGRERVLGEMIRSGSSQSLEEDALSQLAVTSGAYATPSSSRPFGSVHRVGGVLGSENRLSSAPMNGNDSGRMGSDMETFGSQVAQARQSRTDRNTLLRSSNTTSSVSNLVISPIRHNGISSSSSSSALSTTAASNIINGNPPPLYSVAMNPTGTFTISSLREGMR